MWLKGLFKACKVPAVFLLGLILSACGGGGGSSSDTPATSGTSGAESENLVGTLLDSPIQNVSFSTSSGLNGKTNFLGEFYYKAGDQITFSIGKLVLPTIDAARVISPLEIFESSSPTSNEVINFIRLIQTLDNDGDIETAITIPDSAIDALQAADLDIQDLRLPYTDFATSTPVQALLQSTLTRANSLTTITSAIEHLHDNLASSEFLDFDKDGQPNAIDADDDNDGVNDEIDAMPFDPTESSDFDGDLIGDNKDTDDDNDGVLDTVDTDLKLITDLDSSVPAITDIIHDTQKDRLYISHKSSRTLSVIDINTGELIKSVTFSYMPERMTMSADGSKLYVALLTREHSSYWWEEDQTGFIAVIDLNNLLHTNTLAINTDPYDLVVTSAGKLIVTSGSGQWTDIYAYDANTGAVLGSSWIRQRSRLSLHPSENWVFTADTDSSPSDIEKFDISGAGIVHVSDSPYHGDYRMSGNVWPTPDGLYVITRGGDIFLASDMTFVASLSDTGESIENISFDSAKNMASALLSNGEVLVFNTISLEVIQEYVLFGSPVGVYLGETYSYVMTEQGGIVSIVKEIHPCLECASNTTPQAAFTYTPLVGDTTETYVFDASTSSDDQDSSSLQYRWDFDNDGVYDTTYSGNSTANHQFILAGTKFVRLQVKDSGGLVDTATVSINVAHGSDSGTNVNDSVAYQLQFTRTDVEVDHARGKAYITDKIAQRLYVVDLATGFTERYFEFGYMPERMAITPDGSMLYVALLTAEHSSYRQEADQSGFVAEIDLVQQAHTNTFAVAIDPYDLVVTNAGKLIVSSGSGQWTDIHAYDVNTGALLGSGFIRQQSRLSLHPSENWVFAADSDVSPSDIEKFDISGVGITSLGDSPYHGDHRMSGNVWATPDGNHVITRGGDIFMASDMTYVSSLTALGVFIDDLVFDEQENVVFVIGSDNSLNYYNLSSFEFINAMTGVTNPERVNIFGSNVYVYETSGVAATINSFVHPCAGCGSNTAPQAAFTISPDSAGDTTDTFAFDASSSNDIEDGTALSFRWDFNNDGVFDTDYSNVNSYSHNFTLAGTKTIRLRVRDSGGLVSDTTVSVNVAQGTNPGTDVTDSVAFEMPFNSTDVEVDQARGKAYITDKAAQRLYIVDLATGFTERYFEFASMPERMAITPDGNMLYVALLTAEHSSYRWEADQSGFIAEIDLVQQAHTNTFAIGIDPYDLVVTSAGKLIVSSGSGQWTAIHAYDVNTEALLGSGFIRQQSRLSLHPSENWVFAANTDTSPSDIEKFDISGAGITSNGNSPYHGHHRMSGNVWATPDGIHVITRGGDIFLASDMTYVSSLTAQGVLIDDLVFDEQENVVFVIGSDNSVNYYNMTSYELIDAISGSTNPVWINYFNNEVFIYEINGATETLAPVIHPCLGCSTNTAPQASFTITPGTGGDTTDSFIFDASASSDAEDGSALSYRWDFNNDGVYDTDYSSVSSYSHNFALAGTKTISLRVKDSGGLIATSTVNVDVAQGTSPGTDITDSVAFELQFNSTAVEVDRVRGKAYITDKTARRLYIIDLSTGFTERYFEFASMPERMTITPDGTRLYLALLINEHSYTRPIDSQSGLIAEIDLLQQLHTNTFEVAIDPYDLVVTNAGKLIVSSGSGQWTDIHAYDVNTGVLLGNGFIRHRSRLSLHPSENWVFAANTDLSPSDIEKFDISGVGITSLGDSPYHGTYSMSGNVWATPDGNHVITRGGHIFLASDMTYVTTLSSVAIDDLSFNETNGTIVAIGTDDIVYTYSLTTWAQLSTNISFTNPLFVMESDSGISILFESGGSYQFFSL